MYRRTYSELAISKEVDCFASSSSNSVSALWTRVFIGCCASVVVVSSRCAGTGKPSGRIWKIVEGAGYPKKINRVRDNRLTHIARASALLGFEYKRAAMLDLELEVVDFMSLQAMCSCLKDLLEIRHPSRPQRRKSHRRGLSYRARKQNMFAEGHMRVSCHASQCSKS